MRFLSTKLVDILVDLEKQREIKNKISEVIKLWFQQGLSPREKQLKEMLNDK